jgi:ribosome-associated protein
VLARTIAASAISKKATDVLLLDLRKLDAPADFFVLCNADSSTQARAIAEEIRDRTKKLGVSPWHAEGLQALSWVLIDYVDVVVHVFLKESRSFYSLERLWRDAPQTEVEDTPKGIVFKKAAKIRRAAGARPAGAKKAARKTES